MTELINQRFNKQIAPQPFFIINLLLYLTIIRN